MLVAGEVLVAEEVLGEEYRCRVCGAGEWDSGLGLEGADDSFDSAFILDTIGVGMAESAERSILGVSRVVFELLVSSSGVRLGEEDGSLL